MACQAKVQSGFGKDIPLSSQVELEADPQRFFRLSSEGDIEESQSVTEAVEKIKLSYKKIKELLTRKDFEEASQEAHRMAFYTQSIPDLMENVSFKERAQVQALAQELNRHAFEVAQFAQQKDVKSARFHLKHVVWQAFIALRSRVIKRALEDENAAIKENSL